MLVYRVFPYLPSAKPGRPGHPLYEHRPQAGGRIDHPDYFVGTCPGTPRPRAGNRSETCIAGTSRCSPSRSSPAPGEPSACSACPMSSASAIDDPAQLTRLGLRPTQVVTRNLSVTQRWGHRAWS